MRAENGFKTLLKMFSHGLHILDMTSLKKKKKTSFTTWVISVTRVTLAKKTVVRRSMNDNPQVVDTEENGCSSNESHERKNLRTNAPKSNSHACVVLNVDKKE